MGLEPSLPPSERIVGLIQAGVRLVIACARCGHEDVLDSAALRSRFSGREWLTLGALSPRLRCEACGSRDGEVSIDGAGEVIHEARRRGL